MRPNITKSVDAGIANNEAEADLVFEKFLALCQAAGPKKCALAGKGPVKARVQALLQRLRQGPIPARSAPPPRQLRYGDALVAFWTTLGTPPLAEFRGRRSTRRPTATARGW